MAINELIYPIDFASEITGPTELELRVLELEARLRLANRQLVQSRRETAQSTIDLRTNTEAVDVLHAPLARFNSAETVFGTKGFYIGGETSNSLTDKIYRMDFGSERVNLIGSGLTSARHSGSVASTQQNGFIAGGNTTSGISGRVDRLSFSRETISQLGVALQLSRSELSAWSTSRFSYFWGGANDLGVISNTIEMLSQPANIVTTAGVSLGTPLANAAALASVTNGYSVGGKTALGSNYSTAIYKFGFDTAAISLAGMSLGTATAFSTGVGNRTHGYAIAGRTAVGTIATVTRLAYGTDALSIVGISLSSARSDAAGTGTSVKGYIAAGGTLATGEFKSSTPVATFDRLTFATATEVELMEPLAVQLGSATVGTIATSDYAPAIQAQRSRSVANIYDAIYPRRDEIYYRAELRQKIGGNLLIYVDAANLSPNPIGLGTQANPFSSITSALNYAKKFDYDSFTLSVQVAAGTYAESLEILGGQWQGLSSLSLRGNLATPNLVVIETNNTVGRAGLSIAGDINVSISGFKIQSSQTGVADSLGLTARLGGRLTYSEIEFGAGLDVHVLADVASLISPIGSTIVTGSATRCHVQARHGGVWSVAAPANIRFVGNLTMQSIFVVESDGGLNLPSSLLSFVGSDPVTALNLLQTNGWADTGAGTSLDDPAAFAGYPGTLGYSNTANVVRRYGNQTILDTKTFANPIFVPTGTQPSHATNLAQLNSVSNTAASQLALLASTVSANQIAAFARDAVATGNMIIFPNGLKVQWGQASTGDPDWNLTGRVTGSVTYPVPFVGGYPTVLLTVRQGGNVTLNLLNNSPNNYFEWAGDAVRNMDLDNGDRYAYGVAGIQWLAFGY